MASFSQTVAGNLAYWYRSQLFRFSGSGQLEFDLVSLLSPFTAWNKFIDLKARFDVVNLKSYNFSSWYPHLTRP